MPSGCFARRVSSFFLTSHCGRERTIMRLEGAKCLITGCSSGLGRATAIALAKAGSRVWATARRLQTIEDLAAHGLELAELDVRDADGIRKVVGNIAGVDVLINNAGYGLYEAVEEVADHELF